MALENRFAIRNPKTGLYRAGWAPSLGYQWTKDPLEAHRYSSAKDAYKFEDIQHFELKNLGTIPDYEVVEVMIRTKRIPRPIGR